MDDKTELKNARSQSLQGNFTERISKTAFSYDERLIGCSSWTGEVRVFDMKTRETVSTLFSKTPVLDIAFKNDCNGIACGTLSGEVLFSHAMTMSSSLEERSTSDEMMKVVGTHEDSVRNVFFLEDKPNIVFSSGFDMKLKGWDLRLPAKSRKILDIALSFKPALCEVKNNKILLISKDGQERSYDSSIVLLTTAPSFDRMSRAFTLKTRKQEPHAMVNSVALSNNQVPSDEKNGPKEQRCDFVLGLSNGKCSVECYREEFDEKYGYSFLCHRQTVVDEPKYVFNYQQGNQTKMKNMEKRVINHSVNGCTFIKNSPNLLCTGGGDGRCEIWNTNSRRHLETIAYFKNQTSITGLNVNKAGTTMAIETEENGLSRVYLKYFVSDQNERRQ